ncbi:MAG: terminase large subunit, partial [Bacteroides sp.]
MDKLEKEEIRQLKTQTIHHLSQIDVSSYNLNKTDKRLAEYAQELINKPECHNLYELLALKRFFYFMDKYIFKPKEVKKF